MNRCQYLVIKALAYLATTMCAGAGTAALWLNPRLDLSYHIWNTTLVFGGWAAFCIFIAAVPNEGCTRKHYPSEGEGFFAKD